MRWIPRAATRVTGCLVCLHANMVFAAEQEPRLPLAQGNDVVALPGVGRVIVVFLLITGLAVAAVYILRRYSPGFVTGLKRQGPLQVLDRAVLNPGLRVHLVESEGERVLIAESRSGIAMLSLRGTAKNEIRGDSP